MGGVEWPAGVYGWSTQRCDGAGAPSEDPLRHLGAKRDQRLPPEVIGALRPQPLLGSTAPNAKMAAGHVSLLRSDWLKSGTDLVRLAMISAVLVHNESNHVQRHFEFIVRQPGMQRTLTQVSCSLKNSSAALSLFATLLRFPAVTGLFVTKSRRVGTNRALPTRLCPLVLSRSHSTWPRYHPSFRYRSPTPLSPAMSKASLSKLGDAAFERTDKVSAELLALTYGSFVRQLLIDYEDAEEVNAQLARMGYNIGA